MRCKDLLLLVAFVVLAFLGNNLHGVIRQRGRKICHKKKGKETEGKGIQSNRNKKAGRAFKGWSEGTPHPIKLFLGNIKERR